MSRDMCIHEMIGQEESHAPDSVVRMGKCKGELAIQYSQSGRVDVRERTNLLALGRYSAMQ